MVSVIAIRNTFPRPPPTQAGGHGRNRNHSSKAPDTAAEIISSWPEVPHNLLVRADEVIE